jgi:hypothetical protein
MLKGGMMHIKKSICVLFLFTLFGLLCYSQLQAEVQVRTEWTQTYGSTLNDLGSNVIQTSDGGYLWTGFLGSPQTFSDDACLTKVDSLGNLYTVPVTAGVLQSGRRFLTVREVGMSG